MKDSKSILLSLSLGFLFSLLFYNQNLGLNLAIYEIICFSVLIFTRKIDFSNSLMKFALISQGITLLSILYNYSVISIFVHMLFVILSIGVLVYPSVKSVFYAMFFAMYSMFSTPYHLLLRFIGVFKYQKINGKSIWKYKFYIIPSLIILIFILIYKNASPQFQSLILPIEVFIIKYLPNIWEYINADYIAILFIGIIGSAFLFINTISGILKPLEVQSVEHVVRLKNKSVEDISTLSLKKELKSGLFLLGILNVILLIVNSFDVYSVWFNFKWNGEYLKQFVHEGTYLLLLSIILSAIIVLYYFRRNQNFYANSKALKTLSYIWIAQNILLCISVAIRNYWYIDYFNLAYKRIGVFVFLLLAIYGLYTIFLKVKFRRSNYYLIRKNSYALALLLLITSLFNWDVIITKYNFKHANHAFIHFDYLVNMSPKALPYLDKSLEELQTIEKNQCAIFKDSNTYMSAQDFYLIVQNHKRQFISDYSKQRTLSWNYSDQKTARLLLKINE